jgi:hypothetical protein
MPCTHAGRNAACTQVVGWNTLLVQREHDHQEKADGLFLGVWALLSASTTEDGGGDAEAFGVVKQTMEASSLGTWALFSS